MNIEDNQIFLSGIESYDAPREETLINVNFCAIFRTRIYEEVGRGRVMACLAAMLTTMVANTPCHWPSQPLVTGTREEMLFFATETVRKYNEFRHFGLDPESSPNQQRPAGPSDTSMYGG